MLLSFVNISDPSKLESVRITGVTVFKVGLGSFTLHFGLKYEIIYQLDAIEYLFVFFQLDMFRAYTPIFRSNGCYNFFTYAAYGVLGVVRCRS